MDSGFCLRRERVGVAIERQRCGHHFGFGRRCVRPVESSRLPWRSAAVITWPRHPRPPSATSRRAAAVAAGRSDRRGHGARRLGHDAICGSAHGAASHPQAAHRPARGNDTVLTRPGVRSRVPSAGGASSRGRDTRRSPLSLRLTLGKSSRGRMQRQRRRNVARDRAGDVGIARRRGWRADSAAARGISVPTGCGKLKVAAWMVPNGEASMCARARCDTSGWRAMQRDEILIADLRRHQAHHQDAEAEGA